MAAMHPRVGIPVNFNAVFSQLPSFGKRKGCPLPTAKVTRAWRVCRGSRFMVTCEGEITTKDHWRNAGSVVHVGLEIVVRCRWICATVNLQLIADAIVVKVVQTVAVAIPEGCRIVTRPLGQYGRCTVVRASILIRAPCTTFKVAKSNGKEIRVSIVVACNQVCTSTDLTSGWI